jgi:hypothetical protein
VLWPPPVVPVGKLDLRVERAGMGRTQQALMVGGDLLEEGHLVVPAAEPPVAGRVALAGVDGVGMHRAEPPRPLGRDPSPRRHDALQQRPSVNSGPIAVAPSRSGYEVSKPIAARTLEFEPKTARKPPGGISLLRRNSRTEWVFAADRYSAVEEIHCPVLPDLIDTLNE